MKFVGPRFGNHADLRTRRSAFVRIGVARGHAKFLDRILGLAQHPGKSKSTHLVVVVHAIQCDVALV
jgi:hypothetical protein